MKLTIILTHSLNFLLSWEDVAGGQKGSLYVSRGKVMEAARALPYSGYFPEIAALKPHNLKSRKLVLKQDGAGRLLEFLHEIRVAAGDVHSDASPVDSPDCTSEDAPGDDPASETSSS